jgi:hypothetical protein
MSPVPGARPPLTPCWRPTATSGGNLERGVTAQKSKVQSPNPKTIMTSHKVSRRSGFGFFARDCDLGFVWNLETGILNISSSYACHL